MKLPKAKNFPLDNWVSHFGSELYQIITETGERRSTLADRAELARSSITNYIKGETLPEKPETIVNICRALPGNEGRLMIALIRDLVPSEALAWVKMDPASGKPLRSVNKPDWASLPPRVRKLLERVAELGPKQTGILEAIESMLNAVEGEGGHRTK